MRKRLSKPLQTSPVLTAKRQCAFARLSAAAWEGSEKLRSGERNVYRRRAFGGLFRSDRTRRAGTKAAHYARIQELARRFKERNASIVCREILGARASTNPTPEARTPEYYKTRPCAKMCGDAAEILENFLIERKLI